MEIQIHCVGYQPTAIKVKEKKLNLSDLQRYFVKATGLAYFSKGKRYLLPLIENTFFELEEEITSYEAVCPASEYLFTIIHNLKNS